MWQFLIGIIAAANYLLCSFFPLNWESPAKRGDCGKLLISIISNLDKMSPISAN